MLSSAQNFVDGMIETFSATLAPTQAGPAGNVATEPCQISSLFGRIVSVYQSNDVLLSELKSLNLKVTSARTYLETPGSNTLLAKARLNQLKARRSALLTLLRANRIEAQALLKSVDCERLDPS